MATATLTPDTTLIDNSSGVTGAASVHAALSDSSDSSYVTLSDADNVSVRLDDLPAAAEIPALIRSFRAVGRINKTVSSDSATMTVQVNSGPFFQELVMATVSPSGTIDDFATSYKNTSPFAPYVDNAVAQLEVTSSFLQDVRLYEFAVECVYVEPGSTSVDAVSPDPYTTSSTPPISWTNTLDSDGGSQTLAQVRILDDSSSNGYNDPLFTTDALETWPAVASVDVVGSSTSTSAPSLPNDTYRAYVRVAQTVNGVLLWSDWDFDQFTMNAPGNEVSSIVATPSNVDGSISVVITDTSSEPDWEYVELQRTTDGGTTWEYVRFGKYTSQANPPDEVTVTASTATIVDYEVRNNQTVTYRARFTYTSGGLTFTGSWVESSSTSWTSGSAWLKSPTNPDLNNEIVVVPPMNPVGQMKRSGSFQVLGRRNPVTVSDVVSGATWSITCRVDDDTAISDLLALVEDGGTLLLDHPQANVTRTPGAFLYLEPRMIGQSWMTPGWWGPWRTVTIEFAETDAPADVTAGI